MPDYLRKPFSFARGDPIEKDSLGFNTGHLKQLRVNWIFFSACKFPVSSDIPGWHPRIIVPSRPARKALDEDRVDPSGTHHRITGCWADIGTGDSREVRACVGHQVTKKG